jgi:hypothetical protein
VVDVLVERPGELALEHHTPDRTYRLATITVAEGAPSAAAAQFGLLRRAPELAAERQQLDRWLAAPRTRSWPWSPRWTTQPPCRPTPGR